MLGATFFINDKKFHTCRDWKLAWESYSISAAEAQTYTIDIPGMDGVLDLTESLGDVKYKTRKINLVFNFIGKHDIKMQHVSEIKNIINGQTVKVVLDIDKNFYWQGRARVTFTNDSYWLSKIEIEIEVDPYKYEKVSSLEDWKWDEFSFKDGIIRNYKDLKVNGTLKLIIPGRRKKTYPYITCSKEMDLKFKNNIYNLPAGKVQAFGILLEEGNNILEFIGNGTVSVEYRGGSL